LGFWVAGVGDEEDGAAKGGQGKENDARMNPPFVALFFYFILFYVSFIPLLLF